MADREQTPHAPLPRPLRGLRQERRPGSPRPFVHKVKVTPEQEERLILRAAERRITVARLLVESALTGGADAAKATSELAGELFRISRLLGKIGVNVNQVARLLNGTGEVAGHAAGTLAAAERAITALEASASTWADDGVVPRYRW